MQCSSFFVNRDFVNERQPQTGERREREKRACKKTREESGHTLPVLQEARRASFYWQSKGLFTGQVSIESKVSKQENEGVRLVKTRG
jgi:hypothetical protein